MDWSVQFVIVAFSGHNHLLFEFNNQLWMSMVDLETASRRLWFHQPWLVIYTEQKWKRYTTILYILWENIGQKVFTKA